MALAIFGALNVIVLSAIIYSFGSWIGRLYGWTKTGVKPLVPLHAGEKPCWTLAEFFIAFGVMIVVLASLQFAFVKSGLVPAPKSTATAKVEPAVDSTLDSTADSSESEDPAVAVQSDSDTTADSNTEAKSDGDSDSPTVDSAADALDVEEPASTVASMDTSSLLALLFANTAAGIAAMVVAIAWIMIIYNGTFENLGLIPNRSDALWGLKGALWFIPPTLILSGLVSWLIPYHHPALDILGDIDSSMVWGLLFLSTAIIVPLVEEFMFRVMLQGGLQRIADGKWRSPTTEPITVRPIAGTVDQEVPSETLNPYQPVQYGQEPIASEAVAEPTSQWQPRSWWPIVVASIVFAAMHLGQGAAPIPLFFLSLGLGYLYRQTGRITAPYVVHMTLNSITMLVELSKTSAGL